MKNREMSAQNKVIIRAHNLNKTYHKSRQQITVLHDINLEIRQGEIVAITGASGSGKSTLLHLLAGLDRPTSGQVIVNNQDLSKMSDKQLSQFRNQTIGFIFQSFYLHPFLTLEKNVEVPAMFLKMKRDQRTTQVTQLLKRVGLADWAKHFPKELSGGQIQRAAIARALVNSPSIIFADEPTGNLDSVNSDLVLDLLKQIRQDLGTTIVIVTHNPEIVAKADRHIMLKDGMILDQAPSTPAIPVVPQSTPQITTKITRRTLEHPAELTKAEQRQAEFLTKIRHTVVSPTSQPTTINSTHAPINHDNSEPIAQSVRLDARRQQQRAQANQQGFTLDSVHSSNKNKEKTA